MDKLSSDTKSLVGEFYTVAQLFHNGFVASPTLGKTKHVDILVHSPKTEKRLLLEVKTTDENKALKKRKIFGTNYEWMMNQKHEKITDRNLFYCFVLLRGERNLPRFFIVPSKEVARYVKWEHKHYLSTRKKPVKDVDVRVFRISHDDRKYENKWDALNI